MTEPTKEQSLLMYPTRKRISGGHVVLRCMCLKCGSEYDVQKRRFDENKPCGKCRTVESARVTFATYSKLNEEIKSLKDQLADVVQLLRRIKSACSPSDIITCEQELEKFLKKQDKENKDKK